MSHPSLGLPPRHSASGQPRAAAAIRAPRARLAVRALETAIDVDPSIRFRHDELGLRRLLHDAEVLLDQVAAAVWAGDPGIAAAWAEMVAPLYRRRRVPMDDLVALAEGCRRGIVATLEAGQDEVAQAAIDEAIRVFRWHRRLAGDARRRNPILAAIYKGA